MARTPNRAASGAPFDDKTVEAVWDEAKPDPGYTISKRDSGGASISRSAYGETAQFGWEIDHIKPVSAGGTNDLGDLQPLHWENTRHTGDSYPTWDCKKRS